MRQFILLTVLCCLTSPIWGQRILSLDSMNYFPKSVYEEVGNNFDRMLIGQYSSLLEEFSEPKIFLEQEANSVYRFTWTRSFHEKMIIRLVVNENKGILITKTEIKQPIESSKKENNNAIDKRLYYRIDSTSIERSTITQLNTLTIDRELWTIKNTWRKSGGAIYPNRSAGYG